MDEILLRRLVGAVTLLLLALLLTVLLPAPDPARDAGVTYEFNGGSLRPVIRGADPVVTVAPEEIEAAPQAEAAAAPEPVPAQPAQAASPEAFYVQIGTFRDRENAQGALQRMRRAGHEGRIEVIAGTRSTVLHRVRIGPYDDEARARSAMAAAEGQGFGGSKLVTAARP